MTTHALRSLCLTLLLVVLPAVAAAQQPRLLRERTAEAWRGCPAIDPGQGATVPQRQEAERLAASASQAAILGDTRAAVELLNRAALLDPASPDIAFHQARALEEAGRVREAVDAYCRYVGLSPDAPDAPETAERVATLATSAGLTAAPPAAAIQAFDAGIVHHDSGRMAEAEAAFTQARSGAPDWAAPLYNRAVVRLALGRRDAAVADLREYLELGAGGVHAREVVDLLATLPGGTRPPFSSTNALVAGMLVPGLGHFTTGRTGTGALVLGAAAGALGVGLAVERIQVQCLSPPVDGRCPPEDVVNESSERPFLVPGAIAAALIGAIGAYDAWRGAERRNARAAERFQTGASGRETGISLAYPGVELGPAGARLELVRLRFR